MEFGKTLEIQDNKEIKITKELRKKYNLHPALMCDAKFGELLLFMDKMAISKKDKEKIQLLKDLLAIKTLNIISKKLDGYGILEMLKENVDKEDNTIDFEKIVIQLLGGESD